MNSKLLKEYEEFEGLSGVPVDEDLLEEKEDENDPSNRPAVAASLSPEDFNFEVSTFPFAVSSPRNLFILFLDGSLRFEGKWFP